MSYQKIVQQIKNKRTVDKLRGIKKTKIVLSFIECTDSILALFKKPLNHTK